MNRIHEDIRTYGFHAVGVFPVKAGDPPAFEYTVTAHTEPYDLITTGLGIQGNHSVIWNAWREIHKRSITLAQVDAQGSVALRDVITGRNGEEMIMYLMRSPQAMARGATLARRCDPDTVILSLVWADPNGLYPWDAGMDDRMREVQGFTPFSVRV